MRAVHGNPRRSIKKRRAPCSIGASGHSNCTGESRYHSCGGDLADSVVLSISHEDIAAGVHGDAIRIIKLRGAPGAISATFNFSRAGQSRHDPCRGDLADGAVIGVRHIDVPCAVHRYPKRICEPCIGTCAIDTAAIRGQTSQRSHCPSRRDFADGVVRGIGHVNVPCTVHRSRIRIIEPGLAPRAIASRGVSGEGGKIIR